MLHFSRTYHRLTVEHNFTVLGGAGGLQDYSVFFLHQPLAQKKLAMMPPQTGPDYILEGNPDSPTFPSRAELNKLIKLPEYAETYKSYPNDLVKVKQKQDIKEENVFIPDVFILVNEDFCPECQVELLQGQDVLELVINREKCRRWNLVPLETEKKALKCPQCKEDYLLFEQFWLAD